MNENEFDKNVYANLKNAVGPALPKIIETFLKNSKEDFATLQAHLRENNFEAVSKSAHKLKSSSGYLGLIRISTLAKKIEFGAKEKNSTDEIHILVKDMQTSLATAWDFLATKID